MEFEFLGEVSGKSEKPSTTKPNDSGIEFEFLDKATEQPSGFLRQAADIPIQFAKGIGTGTRGFTDVIGADNPVSKMIAGYEDYMDTLLSAESRNDSKRVAQMLQEAKDGGFLDKISAGFEAFASAPLETTANVAGYMVPQLAIGIVGKAAQLGKAAQVGLTLGTGFVQGVGTAKGNIYQNTKEYLREQGVPEDQIEPIAVKAQSYNGENLDQLLLSGGLNALAASTGAEAILTRVLAKEGKEVSGGIIGGILKGAAKEGSFESVQGAQEEVTKNIPLQRLGYDVPTFQGAIESATTGLLAGGFVGGLAGGAEALSPEQKEQRDIDKEAERRARELEAGNAAAQAISTELTRLERGIDNKRMDLDALESTSPEASKMRLDIAADQKKLAALKEQANKLGLSETITEAEKQQIELGKLIAAPPEEKPAKLPTMPSIEEQEAGVTYGGETGLYDVFGGITRKPAVMPKEAKLPTMPTLEEQAAETTYGGQTGVFDVFSGARRKPVVTEEPPVSMVGKEVIPGVTPVPVVAAQPKATKEAIASATNAANQIEEENKALEKLTKFNPPSAPTLQDARSLPDAVAKKGRTLSISGGKQERNILDPKESKKRFDDIGYERQALELPEDMNDRVSGRYGSAIANIKSLYSLQWLGAHFHGGVAVNPEVKGTQRGRIVAHELGHASHSLLGDQINKDQNVLNELQAIEELLYPGLRAKVSAASNPDASFFNYLLSPNELIAEFNVERISNPERAAQVAPALSALLESAEKMNGLVADRKTFPTFMGFISESKERLKVKDLESRKIKKTTNDELASKYKQWSGKSEWILKWGKEGRLKNLEAAKTGLSNLRNIYKAPKSFVKRTAELTGNQELIDYVEELYPAPTEPTVNQSLTVAPVEEEPFGKLPTAEVETGISQRAKEAAIAEEREKIEAPIRRQESINQFLSEGATVKSRTNVVGRKKAAEGGGDITKTTYYLAHPDGKREISLSQKEASDLEAPAITPAPVAETPAVTEAPAAEVAPAEEGQFSIYQMERKDGMRWLVQSGEKRGFGDAIFNTKEDAEKYASDEKLRQQQRASMVEREAQIKRDEEAAKELREKNVNEFTTAIGATPISAGKIKKTLMEKAAKRTGGKVYEGTRAEIVEQFVAIGFKPTIAQVDAIKDLTRAQFNRMDNRQQAEFEKKKKAAGKKNEYRLENAEGYLFDVTKAEYDYANWLESRTEIQPTPAVSETIAPAAEVAPIERDVTKFEQMTPEEVENLASNAKSWAATPDDQIVSKYQKEFNASDAYIKAYPFAPEYWRESQRKIAAGASAKKQHTKKIQQAVSSQEPVSAAAVDTYGITLPQGYIKQGDLYVYQPAVSETIAPAAEVAPIKRDVTKPEQMTPKEFAPVGDSVNQGIYKTKAEATERLSRMVETIRNSKAMSDTLSTYGLLPEDAYTVAKTKQGKWSIGGTHKHKIAVGVLEKQPVSAVAVEAYGITLPEGYTKQGELYVYQPEDTRKTKVSDTQYQTEGVVPKENRFTEDEVRSIINEIFEGKIPDRVKIIEDENNPNLDFKGAYSLRAGTITYNLAYLAKGDDLRFVTNHELGHFIMGDPKFQAEMARLFDSLPAAIREKLIKAIDEAYMGESAGVRAEEAIVFAFGEILENAPDGRNILQRFLDAIVDAINRLLKTKGYVPKNPKKAAAAILLAARNRFEQGEFIRREDGSILRMTPTSPKDVMRDAEYLAAVERGDMETAQRMVDEAAKKAGYGTGPVYHGTNKNFNVFEAAFRGITTGAKSARQAFFLTDDKDISQQYAELSVNEMGEGSERIISARIKGRLKQVDHEGKPYEERKFSIEIANAKEEGYDGVQFNNTDDSVFKEIIGYELLPEIEIDIKPNGDISLQRGNYKGYGEVLPNGFTRLTTGGGSELVKSNEPLRVAAVFEDITNRAMSPKPLYKANRHTVYAVFNPEQIKSADPVTYDDEGNVIPLSQRFQPSEPDIRRMALKRTPIEPEAKTITEGLVQGLDIGKETNMPINNKIESHIKNFAFVRGIFESASDRLRRAGFTKLATAIDDYYDQAQRRLGFANKILLPAFDEYSKQSKSTKKKIDEEVKMFFAAQENKRDTAEFFDELNPITQKIVTAWQKFGEESGSENQRIGIKVFDKGLQRWRPIGRVEKFWPRVLKPEYKRALMEPDKYQKEYNEIVEALMKAGRIQTPEEAEVFISDYQGTGSQNDYFSGIEAARGQAFPEELYDYSTQVMTDYVARWAQHSSRIEQFGQKLGENSKTLWDRSRESTRDRRTIDYITAAQERVEGYFPNDPIVKGMATLNIWSSGLQLGNPASSMLNFFGGTTLNAMVGQPGALSSYVSSFAELRKLGRELKDAREKGIVSRDLMNIVGDHQAILDSSGLAKAGQKTTDFLLKWSGFTPVEQMVRTQSMIIGKSFLRKTLSSLSKNPNSSFSKQALTWLNRNNIDADKLIVEQGTGPETDRLLRYFANISQGSYTIAQSPIFTDTPIGRFLFKYQKFSTQVMRQSWKNTFEPAWKAVTNKKETLQLPDPTRQLLYRLRLAEAKELGDNRKITLDEIPKKVTKAEGRALTIIPVMMWLGAAYVGGEVILRLRDMLFGVLMKGPEYEDIIKAFEDDEDDDELYLSLERAWYNLIGMGALGLIGNYAQFFMDWQDRERVKNPLDPPALSIFKETGTFIQNAADQGQITTGDVNNYLNRTFSAYRVSQRLYQTAASGLGYSKAPTVAEEMFRREVASINKYARRWASSAGLEYRTKRPMDIAPSKMTPINREIANYLQRGEPGAAAAYAKEYLKSLPKSERANAIQSMESGARNRQPLRLGSGPMNQVEKIAFKKWLKEKVSKEKFDEIQKLESQYQKNYNIFLNNLPNK